MDHVPKPSKPTGSKLRVPFIGLQPMNSSQMYPSTSAHMLHCTHPIRSDGTCEQHTRQQERFCQSVYFFGLLYAFLEDKFDVGEYVEVINGVRYIHTKNLNARLLEWHVLASALDPKHRKSVFDSKIALVRESQRIMGLHHNEQIATGFNHAISWSIILLAETLSCALHSLDSKISGFLDFHAPPDTHWDAQFDEHMMGNGWCPNGIAAARMVFQSVAGREYVRNMKRVGKPGLHGKCAADDCQRLRIDAAIYKPKHSWPDCACLCVGPNLQDVRACLEEGAYPLLDLTGTAINDLRMEVVSQSSGRPYLALSHVWADGLGNPFEETLPCCQLLQLRHYLEQASTLNLDKTGQRLLLWCDTLCCPVVRDPTSSYQQDMKAKALSRMRDVYTNALCVLVLDSTLTSLAYSNVGMLEMCMHLFASPWMRRLWTLQEGALAKILLFKFQDTLVSLDDIANWTQGVKKRPFVERAIAGDILVQWHQFVRFRIDKENTGFVELRPTDPPDKDHIESWLNVEEEYGPQTEWIVD